MRMYRRNAKPAVVPQGWPYETKPAVVPKTDEVDKTIERMEQRSLRRHGRANLALGLLMLAAFFVLVAVSALVHQWHAEVCEEQGGHVVFVRGRARCVETSR
jgi:hypothetical protein